MEFDLGLYSDHIITLEGSISGFLIIESGKIKSICKLEEFPELLGDERIEHYQEFTILPGVIDPHVHVNEPGRTHWEGFETATKAAATGGITTLIDMPLNCDPVTTTAENLHYKMKEMTSTVYSQIGFHGGILPDTLDQISSLYDAGVYTFKIFLIHSGIDEFPHIPRNQLREVMTKVAELDATLMIHAELETKVDNVGDPQKYISYLRSRPREWENEAIKLLIDTMRETNCKTHIIHLSSSDALPMIEKARNEGLPLTVETCPHYLYFAAEDIEDGKTEFKCAPPIRERSNREILWDALSKGLIDFIASDHSPSPPELKYIDTGDFMNAWGGIASLQYALPIIWTQAIQRGINLEDVSKLMSTNPAKFLGLKNKGYIAEGMDADLIIFDPIATFTVNPDNTLHKHKVSPYNGESLKGVVKATFIGGQKIFDKTEGVYKHLENKFI